MIGKTPARRWLTIATVLVLGASATAVEAGLVFTALDGGLWKVFWQPGQRSAPQLVASGLGSDASAPVLSPDGSRVAFEVAGQGLRVCPLPPGGQCDTVPTGVGSAVRPAWEPRSGELIFARYTADATGEDSDLFITRGGLATAGPLVTQTGNQDDPDVSPDGRWLAYTSAQTLSLHRAGVRVVRHLWVVDLATGGARPLAAGAHQDMHPDWSPDGRWIAFASDRGGGLDIWVVAADGSDLRRLTRGPGAKTWPAWSPDGRQILFAISDDGRQTLSTVDVASGNQQRWTPFVGVEKALRDVDWRP